MNTNHKATVAISDDEARRIYFAYRGFGFWLSVGFLTLTASIIGTFQALAPTTFLTFVLGHTAEEAEGLRFYMTMRGVICLTVMSVWVTTFLYRLPLARYTVYFATCFVATNFVRDLFNLTIAESFEAVLASSFFLVLRPVLLMALVLSTFSFTATIPFERGRSDRLKTEGYKRVSG